MVKHRVNLDCATKRVVLRTEGGNEVVVIEEHRNYLANVISALVAEKLVRKGCEAFLAYISVSISGDSTVNDIRTVRDFSNVFPETESKSGIWDLGPRGLRRRCKPGGAAVPPDAAWSGNLDVLANFNFSENHDLGLKISCGCPFSPTQTFLRPWEVIGNNI